MTLRILHTATAAADFAVFRIVNYVAELAGAFDTAAATVATALRPRG